ncbi:nitrous oxide reductase family maturation protein NosD [Marinoscillum sp. 108]|uniref:nitrous oxide reductase family maturation protein NosD n=1 Tax=Marinoscillum sp. 108 TaxID=2653151 RepID=UPI0012EEF135|nr:nitrous oxide reductase family maturation protein NosD [Marinoscillum sp. 108]VXD18293.1 Nitrous oxide reductase [Marinoscillum sp. 108]
MRLERCIMLIILFTSLVSRASVTSVCGDCAITSVAEAVRHARAKDTVRVQRGTYVCKNLTIDKPITLIGDSGAILDGANESYVLRLLADSIVVYGFTITNSGRSYTKDFAAIYAYNTSGIWIENNQVSQSFFGILIEKSTGGTIRGNKVTGTATQEDQSGNGIHLWNCDHMQIESNEVKGMRDGIYLEFVDESYVTDNKTHFNVRYGLHFMFSNHDEYRGNTFQHNGAGVAVMFSKWIRMEQNRFMDNWGTASYGLLLKEIYDGEVRNNTFQENTIGVYVDGSARVTYSGNTFRQNGWAVKVSGGCYANAFTANNFIGNSFDVSYNSKMNDNTFNGNFWSAYSGYDLDKDGSGDVPYRPVKLFSYVVNRTPETIVLLRSLFVDIINFSEKVSPAFTPADLVDQTPSMRIFR